MNILIICGESSANTYGSKLATVFNENHDVYSFGNSELANHSTQLVSIDAAQHSVNIGHRLKHSSLFKHMTDQLSRHTIDRAIIADFPGFNFKIATILQSFNIPISSFITPNFWIWNDVSSAKKLANYSDQIITIFKREYDFYSKISPEKTHYFGHPLLLNEFPKNDDDTTNPTIALFPGSRLAEINDHLPSMLTICDHLSSKYSVVIVCETPDLEPNITTILAKLNHNGIQITQQLPTAMAHAITAPGTNTLRLALMGVPMTIIGCVRWWMVFVAKYILRMKVPFIGLPNVILNQMVYPEHIRPSKKTLQTIAHQLNDSIKKDTECNAPSEISRKLKDTLRPHENYYQKIANIILSQNL